MKLFNKLSEWYCLVTRLEDYKEEAIIYSKEFKKNNVSSILELGSGAGFNAYYMKKEFNMELSDISSNMLSLSKKINSEIVHFNFDMRDFKLNKKYDGIFIHDSISHIYSIKDLNKVIKNAYNTLEPNGMLIIAPDFIKDTFEEYTECGGYTDKENNRTIKYIEWYMDKNKYDNIVEAYIVYVMKDQNNEITIEEDFSSMGIFSLNEWDEVLRENGFYAKFKNATSHDGKEIKYIRAVKIEDTN